MTYDEFIKSKIAIAEISGFEVLDDELPAALKPHQRDIVRWALRGGCRAIFAAFGLGKTIMQLAIASIIASRNPGQKTLIICPLGVKQEFSRDARNFFGVDLVYVRNDAEAAAVDSQFCITNYERVGMASLTRNGSSRFRSTKRRFCAGSVPRRIRSSCRSAPG